MEAGRCQEDRGAQEIIRTMRKHGNPEASASGETDAGEPPASQTQSEPGQVRRPEGGRRNVALRALRVLQLRLNFGFRDSCRQCMTPRGSKKGGPKNKQTAKAASGGGRPTKEPTSVATLWETFDAA